MPDKTRKPQYITLDFRSLQVKHNSPSAKEEILFEDIFQFEANEEPLRSI